MRVALTLVSLCLLLTLGAFGLFLSLPSRPEASPAADAAHSPAPAQEGSSASELRRTTGELLARMDALAGEIDELQAQVAALRAGAERQPVRELAPEDRDSPAVASIQREVILKVMDDARREEERKRQEEQQARNLQMMLARAERTAKRFGLSLDQQRSLADVYLLERQKMEDLRNQLRDQGGLGGDPGNFRDGFREVREWRLGELTTRLGPDLAEQINESEFDGFRGERRGIRGRDREGGDGNAPGGGF